MPPGTARRSCSTASSTDVRWRSATRGAEGVPVEGLEAGGAGFPRELGRPLGARDDQPVTQSPVTEAGIESLGELLLFYRRCEARNVTEHLRQRDHSWG